MYRWTIYPQDPAILMGVEPDTILEWNLTENQTYKIEYPWQSDTPLHSGSTMNPSFGRPRTSSAGGKQRHILTQLSLLNHNSQGETRLCFPSFPLSTFTATAPDAGQKEEQMIATQRLNTPHSYDLYVQVDLLLDQRSIPQSV